MQVPRRAISATILLALCISDAGINAAPAAGASFASTSPSAYIVRRDDTAGTLTVSTAYYSVQHSSKKGGAITSIRLTHGRATNLLAGPVEALLRDSAGTLYTDSSDSSPTVLHRTDGQNETVTVERAMLDAQGRACAVKVRSVYEYRWGYIKVHSQYTFPADGFKAAEFGALRLHMPASLTHFGFREGTTETEGAPPFSFGSCKWGNLNGRRVELKYLPRYWMFADPGVEGLEWFMASNLAQWDLQLTGRRGDGQASLERQGNDTLLLTVSPILANNAGVLLTNTCGFDYYIGLPLLEGHAWKPWLHTSFNRNKGEWVTADRVRKWAEQGIQTVHCHNDGDYYDDGLFWRDGSYPPYPDMDKYDEVLKNCRNAGIRTATYFSNKELHPDTPAYKEHGKAWSRQSRKGEIQHNFLKPKSEFGAQMCLRSGWLSYLKSSIDRVLRNHPLQGVYYDWNVALHCENPLHQNVSPGSPAAGHWDIDELLDLMEWTRQRVGPAGLVIIHNTTTPMFTTENFANYVVANEWGYGKWNTNGPALTELPLEWSLVSSRPRGVISYGQLDSKSPRRLHRLFATQAFLGGVSPWPASGEAFDLLPLLKPVGDLESCRFADWRNSAVTLKGGTAGSAVYCRPDEAFILVANLEPEPHEVTCAIKAENLPYPLLSLAEASLIRAGERPKMVDLQQLSTNGVTFDLPADGHLLLRLK